MPRSRLLLILILAAAAVLRLRGLGSDDHHHLHPDERFISIVEAKLVDPASPREYLDAASSGLNPYNVGFGTFVYGTLPMLLARYAGRAVGLTGYDGTFLAGRLLSTLFDLISIWLAYRIGRRFMGRTWSLVAAGFLAGSPLAIQLSHFWTVDTFLNTFSTAALLASVRMAQGRRDLGTLLLAGVATGLAVSCKVTGLVLLGPVTSGLLVGLIPPASGSRKADVAWRAAAFTASGVVILLLAAFTVRLAFPYPFATPNPLSFELDRRWLDDLSRLVNTVKAVPGFPPNFQWAGRTLGFPIWNLVLWGCSPLFGVPALAGVGAALMSLRRRWAWPLIPLLLQTVLVVGYHGLTLVKTQRYFYPIYPSLAVLAAFAFWRLSQRLRFADTPGWARLAAPACVAATLICGLMFTAVYAREHTRVAASSWIYTNLLPGPIANETWDDALPLPIPGFDGSKYAGPLIAMVHPDNPTKVDEIVEALSKSTGLAVTSNRAYGSLTRLPDVFPMTRAYYQALFDGRLGYRLVADVASYPGLGPLTIADDWAEEALTVYDHPRVLLFRKTDDFTPEQVRAVLMAALPQPASTLDEWDKWPRSRKRTVAPVAPPSRASGGGAAQIVPAATTGSAEAVLWFYLACSLIGLLAFPVTYGFFSRLGDRGFGFARVLGLIAVTYSSRAMLWTGAFAGASGAAWLCLVLLSLVSLVAFLRRRADFLAFVRAQRRALVRSEAVFAAGFLFFIGCRALNPEIYWGEKPMDLSILNILIRSEHLPPPDPWFAGVPFAYYFFGQEMIAVLTALSGLPTRFTYNLAFGFLGGVMLQGAFALVSSWGLRVRAGVAGAVLTLLIGNLAGLRGWLVEGRAPGWDYFWATSRVIPGTINEYPLWSLLFADLHAHVLALPMLLLVVAAILQWLRVHGEPEATWPARLGAAGVVGLVAGVHALTNAWDVPLLIGLIVLVMPLVSLAGTTLAVAAVAQTATSVIVAAATAALVAGTMWVPGAALPGWGIHVGERAHGVDVLTMFGLFFLLAMTWGMAVFFAGWPPRGGSAGARRIAGGAVALALALLAILAIDVFLAAGVVLFLWLAVRLRDDVEGRLACALIATAFFLVLLPQHVFIADRMNAFFKLYLEAWMLFAMATSLLVFRGRDHPGVFTDWARPVQVAAALVFAVAAFTSVTAVPGAVGRHVVAYSGPSLDGLRYLKEQRPAEYRAVLWLTEHVSGTPTMLEAQGPSYQDFSRISMLTGLPTVLGWDYHVEQRGNAATDIQARRDAVREIYEGTDPSRVETLLRRYRVDYVYEGWLERKTYSAAGLQKFSTATSLFDLVFENTETRIFRVKGGTEAPRR